MVNINHGNANKSKMLGPGINHTNNNNNNTIDIIGVSNEISTQETHFPIAVVALPLQRWSLPFRF